MYASNHKSHTDYLVEPLVLDDHGIRPPIIAAGINLFGGPLGLLHRHVTGAIPIRRNTKDPAYLVTLKAYVAELLRDHDLLFYPEGGRSYSGELKPPKTGLIHAAMQAGLAEPRHRADGRLVRPGARGPHPRAPGRQEAAAAVHARAGRDDARRGRLPLARLRHASATRSRLGDYDPQSRRDILDLAHRCSTAIGRLYKVHADRAGGRGDAAVDREARSRGARRRPGGTAARRRGQPGGRQRPAGGRRGGPRPSRVAASWSSRATGPRAQPGAPAVLRPHDRPPGQSPPRRARPLMLDALSKAVVRRAGRQPASRAPRLALRHGRPAASRADSSRARRWTRRSTPPGRCRQRAVA